MTVEVLFNEVCGLFGDRLNASYLMASLPRADFRFTPLTDEPFFVKNEPDIILMGSMTEKIQRRVTEKLMPYAERLAELADRQRVLLFTGNAGEILTREIRYVTEEITVPALGLFDLKVKTDYFRRYNGNIVGDADGNTLVGCRSQFGFIYGDNSDSSFLKCEKGIGINPSSRLEGMRKNNLMCTSILGPVLVLNPDFCRYIVQKAGGDCTPAFYKEARAAYERRLGVFRGTKKA